MGDLSLDGTKEVLPAPEEGGSNWNQLDTGSIFSLDNPDEGKGYLGMSTFGGNEDLFGNVSPGLDIFDGADQNIGS